MIETLEKSSQIRIFTDPDGDYIRSNTAWVARLSNDKFVYQKDDRSNSWLDLKQYVEETGLKIEQVHIRFRDHWEAVPPYKDGYFFIRSLLCHYGSDQVQHMCKTGYLEGDSVYITTWILPELITWGETEVTPMDHEFIKECLIVN